MQEEHSSYPRLHVRQASECSSDEASLVDHHSFDAQSPSFGNPESPDRHSRLSYDENYSTSDFDENLSPSEQRFIESPNEASLLMHIQTPVVEIDHPRVPEIYREQKGDLSEAHQHISAETGIQTKNSFESDLHDFPDETGEEISDTFEFRLQQVSDEYRSQSPYVEFDSFRVSDEFQEEALGSCEVEAVEQYQVCEALTETISNYDELGPQKTSETAKLQTGESLEKNCMEVQCVESLNPQNDIVLPEDQSKSLLLKDIEDYRCADDEQKQDSELENVNSSLQDSEEPSGWQLIDDEPEIQKPNSVDSSPQSSKMSASPSFSEEIKCEGKHERGDGEYTIEVEDTNRKQTTLCNEAPRIPIGAVQLDATEVAEVELSNHLDNIENYTSLSARKDFIKAKSLDQLQLQKFQVMKPSSCVIFY